MKKYIKILKHEDIFPNNKIKKPKKFTDRQTVKAIILNKKDEVALVTNPIHKQYLLPGGGVESKNLKKEIRRECLEEINQEVEIVRIIGKTKEYRDRDAKTYTTTCFFGQAIKKSKKDMRTENERKNGLRVVWVGKEKLKKIFSNQNKNLKNGKINFYNIAFNTVRDEIFINEWLK